MTEDDYSYSTAELDAEIDPDLAPPRRRPGAAELARTLAEQALRAVDNGFVPNPSEIAAAQVFATLALADTLAEAIRDLRGELDDSLADIRVALGQLQTP